MPRAVKHDFLILAECVEDSPTGAPTEIYIEAGRVLAAGDER